MARTYWFFGEVKGVAREIEEEVEALEADLNRAVGGRGLRMDALCADDRDINIRI